MVSTDFWVDRLIASTLAAEKSVLDYESQLWEVYDAAETQIKTEIDAFYNKYAEEGKVSFATSRKRLTTDEKKVFSSQLKTWYKEAVANNYSSDYQKYLLSFDKRTYISRLEYLQVIIRHQLEIIRAEHLANTTELLGLDYTAEYYQTYFDVGQGVASEIEFVPVGKSDVDKVIRTKWNGRNYINSINTDKDKAVSSVNKILPRAFAAGTDSTGVKTQVSKVVTTSRNNAKVIGRTESSFVTNKADIDVYANVGLEEYQYLATLDKRTSEICRSLDGEIFKVSQSEVGVNCPPMHPRCRSTTVPYFDDADEFDGSERIARNEDGKSIYVNRRMTQEEWIKQYAPADQQDDLLSFIHKYK